ncbi:hypothetical protein [Saccharococcus sp. Marseille-Q5394]|uniref:hypothetical protein n=1 Tax=Saccharococcus sp. Marseille-Q5394 TaxID=2972778 RepID=UPI0021C74664|nr:hypothetical protein [Saccharococcus sp. Marseille-Q5394]
MTLNLKEYTRFDNNNDMYAAVRKQITLHAAELTKSDHQVLDAILHHSAMHGAAQLTYPEMQEVTGKSIATVQRAIRKLVKLRIIEKLHYFHPGIGGLGANIYIILPSDDSGEKPQSA